jgi:hypothetical protein
MHGPRGAQSRALLGLQSSEPPSRLLTAMSHRRLAVAGRPLLRIEHMIETLGLSPLLFHSLGSDLLKNSVFNIKMLYEMLGFLLSRFHGLH